MHVTRSASLILAALLLSAAALAETWTQQNPATSPSARQLPAIAYDPVRKQVVLFGGLDEGALGDTWVWNGSNWTQLEPAASPAARYGAKMVWNSTTNQIVLFGGGNGTRYFNDTWIWNGSNWIQQSPETNPPARQYTSLAYDPVHNQVVMFGGFPGLSDTWLWNGSNWSQANPTTNPPQLWQAGMVFDSVHQTTVMYGGFNGSTLTTSSDTWVWDGSKSNWTKLAPAHSPPASWGHSLSFDNQRGITVLFGLYPGSNQTWLWNGADWSQAVTPTSPTPRYVAGMAYDSSRSQQVLFGGATPSAQLLGDTWTESLTFTQSWVSLYAPALPGPSARYAAASSTDSGGNLFLFGGSNGSAVMNDTYGWIGNQWVLYDVSGPPARMQAAMALDTVHNRIVLFGGNSTATGVNLLGDTWSWDGYSWTSIVGAAGPSARSWPAMAFDPNRGKTVLFGGSTAGGSANDTWLYDGSIWTNAAPASPPPIRFGAAMVYDQAHGQILMFGGQDSGTRYNDTWVWDGASWTQKTPANSPSGRVAAAIAYDPQRGRVILTGGFGASGSLNDTWSWDGSNWTQLNIPGPSARFGSSMAYTRGSSAGGQLLLFGGTNSGTYYNDDWLLTAPSANGTLQAAYSGAPYSYTIPVTGGVSPYTFTVDGSPYTFTPFGLTLNSSTGAITGTVSATPNQQIPIGVTITDSQGLATDIPFTLPVVNGPVTLGPATLPDATMGANYNVQLTVSGGNGPYTFSATGLPTGITLNASNQLVGQCQASSTGVVLRVVDSQTPFPGTATLTVALNCNPAPQITDASPLPDGTPGVAYDHQFTTNASYNPPGAAPFSWTLTPGTLPQGFSLSPAGALTGTASSAATSNFSVTFTDRWGATTTRNFQLSFSSQLAITTASLPGGILNKPYPSGYSIVATGGVGSYTYGATGMPPGLSIDPSTGAITGTPTVAGPYSPLFTVMDQASHSIEVNISLPVSTVAPSLDWTRLNPVHSPLGLANHALAYDTARSQIVLFGGYDFDDGDHNETWVWDGTDWTQKVPATSPPARDGHAMAYDAARGQVVLFGGGTCCTNPAFGDTWVWNGTTWAEKSPSNSPSIRSGAAMAYDAAHQQVVLFGGTYAGRNLPDTWVWDGTNWTLKSPATQPPARYDAAMAWDPVHNQAVLFGGNGDTGTLSDTWTWDGTNWTQKAPDTSPTPRTGARMAFDTVRNQAVLFGGREEGLLGDTWAWDGTNWASVQTPHSPSDRSQAALAFDPVHQQTLLFGGSDYYSINADTWVLGGPAVSNTTLPAGTVGVPYSANITVTGGTAPFTFTQDGSPQSLPANLTLDANTGAITGTPVTAGTFHVGISILDHANVAVDPTFTLTINPGAPLTLAPAALPDATAGNPVQRATLGLRRGAALYVRRDRIESRPEPQREQPDRGTLRRPARRHRHDSGDRQRPGHRQPLRAHAALQPCAADHECIAAARRNRRYAV